ncbi:MAG: PEGA domain-containing protein [Acidobacteriota bacterium]
MRWGLSIPCAIALSIAPRVVRADGAGVAAASVSATDRGAVAAALADAMREGGARRIVADALGDARATLASGAVPIETMQRFRRVRDLIDEGWRAYLRVSFDFAQARLAVARTEAEGIVALPGGAELYADAALRLGIVLGQLGHAQDAQAALALALALDPERPITLAEFSPDVVAAVDAARALVPARTQLAIASEPPGALASVDGREVGKTPVTAEVSVGQHVVIARAPGYRPRAQTVAVAAHPPPLELALERDDDWAHLAAGVEPGVADAIAQGMVDAVLRYAELDELVVAVDTDRRGGEALLVQRCAGSPARCTAVVEVGYTRGGLAGAAREAWSSVRGADLRYPPSVLADPRVGARPVPPRRCQWCRSPYLWGGVTAAVVVSAIAIVAAATASRPPPIVGVTPGQYTTP